MDGNEVKKIADKFATVRVAYLEHKAASEFQKKPTELMALTDQFIDLVQKIKAMGPPVNLTVALRPGVARPHAAHALGGGFYSTGRIASQLGGQDLAAPAPWPPLYFSDQELAVLGDDNVRSVLYGVDPKNRDLVDGLSFSSRCPPANVRLALCYLALVYYSPTTDWALSMNPAGFITRRDRVDWHAAIGPCAKMFVTLSSFFDYAYEVFDKQSKEFAVGLLTHWFTRPGKFKEAAGLTIDYNEAPCAWANNNPDFDTTAPSSSCAVFVCLRDAKNSKSSGTILGTTITHSESCTARGR